MYTGMRTSLRRTCGLIRRPEKRSEAGVDDDGNGYVDDIYGYNFAMIRQGEYPIGIRTER